MINGVRIILGPVGIWKRPGRNLKPTDEEVLAQDELADRAVQLVLHILRYRLGALSTWCESWPGLLALLASDDDADVDRCLEELREDYAVLQEVKELGKASKFLAGLAKMSPLNTAPTRELAELVAAGELSRSQRAHLRDWARLLWSGWGQTKCCEDGFKELRKVETQEVANKVVDVARLWDKLRSMHVLGKHGRDELQTKDLKGSFPKPPKLTKELFQQRGYTPSVDCDHICAPQTWTSMTPQGAQSLAAMWALLRHCVATDSLHEAGSCWQCELIPCGTLVFRPPPWKPLLSLGPIGHTALLAWEVVADTVGTTTVYRLCRDPSVCTSIIFLPVLDYEGWTVCRVKGVSPLHQHLLRRKRLRPRVGVALLPTGEPQGVMALAARNAFWKINLVELKKLSVQQGVKLPSPCTLVQAVVALVQEALPGLSPADLAGILSLRALKPTGLCGADLPEELKQAMEEAEPDAAKETT